jgi:hypothetical protein
MKAEMEMVSFNPKLVLSAFLTFPGSLIDPRWLKVSIPSWCYLPS